MVDIIKIGGLPAVAEAALTDEIPMERSEATKKLTMQQALDLIGSEIRKENEATVASAASVDLGLIHEYRILMTGDATVSDLGAVANSRKLVRVSGTPTFVHNGTSLILPRAQNLAAPAGSVFEFSSDDSGNWQLGPYMLSNGRSLELHQLTLARGDLITVDGSGNLVKLGIGSAQEILKSDGTDFAWATSFAGTIGDTQTPTGVTFADFPIPAGAKFIKLSWHDLSFSGDTYPKVQIGDSGGIETTGYSAASSTFVGGVATIGATDGFILYDNGPGSSESWSGSMALSLVDKASFLWEADGKSRVSTNQMSIGAGSKALSSELTTVRLVSNDESSNIDAGSINVIYF